MADRRARRHSDPACKHCIHARAWSARGGETEIGFPRVIVLISPFNLVVLDLDLAPPSSTSSCATFQTISMILLHLDITCCMLRILGEKANQSQ